VTEFGKALSVVIYLLDN